MFITHFLLEPPHLLEKLVEIVHVFYYTTSNQKNYVEGGTMCDCVTFFKLNTTPKRMLFLAQSSSQKYVKNIYSL